ncbi:MAG: hypothetical protein IJZ95_05480 [Oscillospiraceae bacterium]|nr:hypothetical protein [Oscillospiraceae bacterium]
MKKNSMLSLFAAIPAFLLCLVMRFLQIAGATDFRTGFLFDDCGFFMDFGYYGLLILVLIVTVLLCILDKKRSGAFFTNATAGIVDAKAILIGFPLLIAGALAIYEGYMQTKALSPSSFLMFVGFIFGGLMVVQAFVVLYKKEIKAGLGFSFVIPAVYYTLRGIGVFLDRMVVASIPEYLIECLCIIGYAVFFMFLAKLLSGNESKYTRTTISAVGITTAVMTLSNAIAVILADVISPNGVSVRIVTNANEAEMAEQYAIASGKYGYFMSYMSWTDVVIAVTIVLTLVALYKANKPASIGEQENAETTVDESETFTEEYELPDDTETQ